MAAGTFDRIGFIGAGQMAQALAAGFVRAGLVRPDLIAAADPVGAAREAFRAAVPGAEVATENSEVARNASLLFLAVKPQQLESALMSLAPAVGLQHLVVSIVAGAPLAALAEALGEDVRLVRVMPNMPCLVGQSASGYSAGPRATPEDMAHVGRLLGAVGKAYELDERLLDAVTGLAGSGPAFVYVMIEALSDGGVQMGLPRSVATALAAQTVRGAAEMVLAGEHPAVLKDRVASPGGTTIAGLAALEAGGCRPALIDAVRAATRRSAALGRAAARRNANRHGSQDP